MIIQWFPGHMTKAVRLIEENLKLVDAVGYVLDARAPNACFNPIFDKLIDGKTALYILNKCDLADSVKVKAFADALKAQGKDVICVSAVNGATVKAVADAFKKANNARLEKFRNKGIYRPVRAMIIGVPNCGKSTIINSVSGKKKAVTGDKPGVTKGKQWVRLAEGLELLDTPGTLWGKIEDEKSARQLCYIGSIKDDIIDIEELAPFLMEELQEKYPKNLEERYKLSAEIEKIMADRVDADNVGVNGRLLFEALCRKRAFTLRGGELDTLRGAKALLDDLRKGKIGRITFE